MNIEELLELIGTYLNNGMSCADYQYYLNLIEKRTIILNSIIDSDLTEKVIIPLLNFERDLSQEPVTLLINTPGGYLSDGLVLCDIIDNYTKPLRIVVLGYAYSLGSIILCAGGRNPKVEKSCYKFSYALFHPGSLKLEGEANSVRDTMEFNENLEKRLRRYVVENTKITEEEYEEHKNRQWYLDSQAMLRYGLVNKIL